MSKKKYPKGAPAFLRNKGKARVKPLEGESDRSKGFTVESGDGRQGVVVRPSTIRSRSSINGG